MDSRTITLIASIAVIGLVAIGAGYAYTAITVNDGNDATSNYVVLSQSGYTYGNAEKLYYDTVKVSNEANGTTYTLTNSDDVKAGIISAMGLSAGTSAYYGEQIGDSKTLTATKTGTVGGSPFKTTIAAENFADYNGGYWKYILVFTGGVDDVQYAIWDGHNDWTYTSNYTVETVLKTDGIYLVQDKEYTVSLYIGGLGVNVGTQESPVYTAQSTTAPGEHPVNNGKITFTATFSAAA